MRRLVPLAMAGLLGACALTTKASSVELRYFSPESFADPPQPSASVEASSPPSALHLARVESSEHLRGRIAYRETSHELGSYETLRWTESPENYARRALHRALFERGRFSEVVSGPAAVLSTELVAFEDVRRAKGHAGRVVLLYSLRRGERVIASGRAQIERAAEGDDMEATVAALGVALDAAVAKVADEVTASLAHDP